MEKQSKYNILGLLLIIAAGYGIYQYNILDQFPEIAFEGEEVARRQCGYCHQFPTPDLLDKETWENGVLPEMGRRLGVKNTGFDPFKDLSEGEAQTIRLLDVYPEDSLVSDHDWKTIVDYYVSLAPDTLQKASEMIIVSENEAPFQSHFIEIESKEIPEVTVLHYDSISRELYIGDNDQLFALNSQGEFSSRWSLTSPAVDLGISGDGRLHLLTIGSVPPSDHKAGAFGVTQAEGSIDFTMVLDRLPRPVHFVLADLDSDQKEDVIICGFGHHDGELAWYSQLQDKHVLNENPGSRIAVVNDMNQDGLPDIVVLMAQAQEGVDIYYNEGKGNFSKERVLEFSPVHGVSYLELHDFNADGFPDLLISNGDNWDFSSIEKPYHGIRIYLNDGNNNFEESYFYPMNGCNKAIARDFDLDGDMDIAAISFYDHLDNPEKSFVYLENTGDFLFVAHYISEAASGKWLTMEVGDFDQDGYQDLFLGSYFHNVAEWTRLVSAGATTFPEVLYLQNATMMIE